VCNVPAISHVAEVSHAIAMANAMANALAFALAIANGKVRRFGKVYIAPVASIGNQVVLRRRLLHTLLTPRTLVRSVPVPYKEYKFIAIEKYREYTTKYQYV
jgi:hypothetical protein